MEEKQPSQEGSKSPETIIKETLDYFEISPDKVETAKHLGLNVDKIALFTGSLKEEMDEMRKAIMVIAQRVAPAIQLSDKIESMQKAQTQQPSNPNQPSGPNIAGLPILDIISMARQFMGGANDTTTNFFVELGKKTLVDSMSLYNTINRRAMRKLSGEALKEYETEVKNLSDLFGAEKK